MKRYKFYVWLLVYFLAGYFANTEAIKRLFIDAGYFWKGVYLQDTQLMVESLDHILMFFR